ncbi:hypothetical protein H0H92_003172 [Tricholoma furcatifolium]|nr:hypothetical protein H0H92_003172 [Tricholoma furcatifolium]
MDTSNHAVDTATNRLVKSPTELEDKLGGLGEVRTSHQLLELVDVGVKRVALLVVGRALQYKRGTLRLVRMRELDEEPGLEGRPVLEAKGGGL